MTRIQVFFDEQTSNEIDKLRKAEEKSRSQIVSQGFEQYRQTAAYQSRLQRAIEKLDAMKKEITAILGPEVDEQKLRQVLEVLDRSNEA